MQVENLYLLYKTSTDYLKYILIIIYTLLTDYSLIFTKVAILILENLQL